MFFNVIKILIIIITWLNFLSSPSTSGQTFQAYPVYHHHCHCHRHHNRRHSYHHNDNPPHQIRYDHFHINAGADYQGRYQKSYFVNILVIFVNDTMSQWHHNTRTPWYNDNTTPWYKDTMTPWQRHRHNSMPVLIIRAEYWMLHFLCNSSHHFGLYHCLCPCLFLGQEFVLSFTLCLLTFSSYLPSTIDQFFLIHLIITIFIWHEREGNDISIMIRDSLNFWQLRTKSLLSRWKNILFLKRLMLDIFLENSNIHF